MADITEEEITGAVQSIKAAFLDGFQWEDIPTVLREATKFAQIAALSGSEKKALAIKVIERVIDETDTPWLPDSISDAWMKRMAPGLIDWAVDAARGKAEFLFGGESEG
jgi:hypothetical protein